MAVVEAANSNVHLSPDEVLMATNPRIQATAKQIQVEISRRIKAAGALDGDCKDCEATPTPLLDRDADGCNWTVMVLARCGLACVGFVTPIIREVMCEYDLIDS
jgi:hypothetical protein